MEKVRVAVRCIESMVKKMDMQPTEEVSVLFSRLFSIYHHDGQNWEALQNDCGRLVASLKNHKDITWVDLEECEESEKMERTLQIGEDYKEGAEVASQVLTSLEKQKISNSVAKEAMKIALTRLCIQENKDFEETKKELEECLDVYVFQQLGEDCLV